MGYTSDPRFLTMHALRIKGFAKVDVLAELSALAHDDVEMHLAALQDDGHAMFREARALWQLTPDGRTEHAERLAADVEASGASERLAAPVPRVPRAQRAVQGALRRLAAPQRRSERPLPTAATTAR